MGNHHQHKSKTEPDRKPHSDRNHPDNAQAADLNRAPVFSTETILQLQRTIGNQAVQRLLNDNKSGLETRQQIRRMDGSVPFVQRDSLSDIKVESDDFWTHVTTRVMVRYGQWINDTRQALNQFVTDMSQQNRDARSDWMTVMQSWLGVLGTSGDVLNALIASAQALVQSAPEGKTLSLAELSNIENEALQKLSDKTADVNSDLPIYKTLRDKKGSEKPDSQSAYRQGIRTELETALSQLPRPELLRQKLVLQWIKGSPQKGAKGGGRIVYETTYLAHEKGGKSVIAGELAFREPARFQGVDREEGTVTALQGAYGRNAELHKLPIPFHVKIYATPTVENVVFDRELVADWVKEDGTWKPRKGLGTDFSHDLFSDWFKNGRKPTTADLTTVPEIEW